MITSKFSSDFELFTGDGDTDEEGNPKGKLKVKAKGEFSTKRQKVSLDLSTPKNSLGVVHFNKDGEVSYDLPFTKTFGEGGVQMEGLYTTNNRGERSVATTFSNKRGKEIVTTTYSKGNNDREVFSAEKTFHLNKKASLVFKVQKATKPLEINYEGLNNREQRELWEQRANSLKFEEGSGAWVRFNVDF